MRIRDLYPKRNIRIEVTGKRDKVTRLPAPNKTGMLLGWKERNGTLYAVVHVDGVKRPSMFRLSNLIVDLGPDEPGYEMSD